MSTEQSNWNPSTTPVLSQTPVLEYSPDPLAFPSSCSVSQNDDQGQGNSQLAELRQYRSRSGHKPATNHNKHLPIRGLIAWYNAFARHHDPLDTLSQRTRSKHATEPPSGVPNTSLPFQPKEGLSSEHPRASKMSTSATCSRQSTRLEEGSSDKVDNKLSSLIGDLSIANKHKTIPSPRPRKWPTRLTPEQSQQLVRALRSGTIADLPGASCTKNDLARLKPGKWLNDDLINFYGVMIGLRSANRTLDESPFLDIHCFSSFFMDRFESGGHQAVHRWTKKVDLFAKDIVLIPVNVDNAHWICVAINIRKKRFEVYDSLGARHESILNNLRAYLATEHLQRKKFELDLAKWINYDHPNVPTQKNQYDCGVFVCMYMDCLSRKWNDEEHTLLDFGQGQMVYFRRKILYEIVTGKLIPDN
ncbi:hypothetical protein CROQUDRAFT_659921 [Cronartium quercuum f. sp. fusiforme G11]|uniref:Ubiquitin-like protease family profile domain-containing protein n=1 Tax=Cronartium quercuum f. sp. fusiforme G11 TaxID=708437 RepID=A0A9P6TBC9_9BASI|nr:hypothetical protein CROQUDRAFT_659921 [Cronartium quercuum f. sp. fusiforme G11]